MIAVTLRAKKRAGRAARPFSSDSRVESDSSGSRAPRWRRRFGDERDLRERGGAGDADLEERAQRDFRERQQRHCAKRGGKQQIL
jgi:hypothetical protein